jgi:hypothetical protein
MGDDDCGGTVGDGIGKDFSWMDLGFVDKTDGYDTTCDDFVGAIYGDADEMLLLTISIMADQGQNIGGKDYFQPFRADAAAGEFKSSGNKGCLG